MYNFDKMSWGKYRLEECEPCEASSNHGVASEQIEG